jgi:uncharacterized membrane protein YgcG
MWTDTMPQSKNIYFNRNVNDNTTGSVFEESRILNKEKESMSYRPTLAAYNKDVYAIWTSRNDSQSSSTILMRVSHDGGSTFGDVVNLSKEENKTTEPSVLISLPTKLQCPLGERYDAVESICIPEPGPEQEPRECKNDDGSDNCSEPTNPIPDPGCDGEDCPGPGESPDPPGCDGEDCSGGTDPERPDTGDDGGAGCDAIGCDSGGDNGGGDNGGGDNGGGDNGGGDNGGGET